MWDNFTALYVLTHNRKKARKLGARSKIFLFSKTVQDCGNVSADICLVVQAVWQARPSHSLCIYNFFVTLRTTLLIVCRWYNSISSAALQGQPAHPLSTWCWILRSLCAQLIWSVVKICIDGKYWKTHIGIFSATKSRLPRTSFFSQVFDEANRQMPRTVHPSITTKTK